MALVRRQEALPLQDERARLLREASSSSGSILYFNSAIQSDLRFMNTNADAGAGDTAASRRLHARAW